MSKINFLITFFIIVCVIKSINSINRAVKDLHIKERIDEEKEKKAIIQNNYLDNSKVIETSTELDVFMKNINSPIKEKTNRRRSM